MPQRPVELQFPMGGVHRGRGYRAQPPYTTDQALNVRPRGALQRRARGGQRPGLERFGYSGLSSGKINMLAAVTTDDDLNRDYLLDEFDGSAISSSWSTIGGVSAGTVPDVIAHPTGGPDEKVASASYSAGTIRRGVARAWDAFKSTTVDQQASLFLIPYNGAYWGAYEIYLNVASGLDPTVDGIKVRFAISGTTGAWVLNIYSYSSSTLRETIGPTTGTIGSAPPGWLRVEVIGAAVSVFFRDVPLNSTTLTVSVPQQRARGGFVLECSVSGGKTLADKFLYQFQGQRQTTLSQLVYADNGVLYAEKQVREQRLLNFTPNQQLADNEVIEAAEWNEMLFMADFNRDDQYATGGRVSVNSGLVLWNLTLSAALPSSIIGNTAGTTDHSDQYGVEIMDGAAAGVYRIQTVTDSTHLILLGFNSAGSSMAAYDCKYRVTRCAKALSLHSRRQTGGDLNAVSWQYDGAAKTGSRIVPLLPYPAQTYTIAGVDYPVLYNPPLGCDCIAVYRDRLVLAGYPNSSWYMSRQRNPFDWNYGAASTDVGRAVAGTLIATGTAANRIRALVAFKNDYLVLGTDQSLWLMRGDPAYGGSLDNVQRSIGIIGRRAWCRLPDGSIVYLSQRGLYRYSPLMQSDSSEPIGVDNLPLELSDIDSNAYVVNMAYDAREHGVKIHVMPVAAGPVKQHWWFDLTTKSFWPETYTALSQPITLLEHASRIADESCVVMGGQDGILRRERRGAGSDQDGGIISSLVQIGPFRPGGWDATGLANDLRMVLAKGSGPVDFTLLGAATEEEAVAGTSMATGTFVAGLNAVNRPRARAAAFCLQLQNTTGYRGWEMEGLTALFAEAALQRVG